MRPERESAEYVSFEDALRRVLRVSKVDLERILAKEKIAKQHKTKRRRKMNRQS